MKKVNDKYGIVRTPGAKLIADFPVDSFYIYATNEEPNDGKGTYTESVEAYRLGQKDRLRIIDDIVEDILDDERTGILDKIIDIVAIKQMVDKILLEASYMHEKGNELVSKVEEAFSEALTLELAEYPTDEEEDEEVINPSSLFWDAAQKLKDELRDFKGNNPKGNE